METRRTRSKVTFSHAFVLPGYEDRLPAGDYEVMIDEERLQGLTFDAYRRIATFLAVGGNARFPGRTELRPVTDTGLNHAIERDRAQSAALSAHGAIAEGQRQEGP